MQQIPWGNHFDSKILLSIFLYVSKKTAIFSADFSDTSSL